MIFVERISGITGLPEKTDDKRIVHFPFVILTACPTRLTTRLLQDTNSESLKDFPLKIREIRIFQFIFT